MTKAAKPLENFRTGTHTAANGESLEFSDETVRQVAASYDPQLAQAPIVVGHPRSASLFKPDSPNNPAPGSTTCDMWVSWELQRQRLKD